VKPQQIAAELLGLFGPEGEHWTKDYHARNAHGLPVPVVSDEACSWCINGAWAKITGISSGTVFTHPSWSAFRTAIMRTAGCAGVVTWNDSPDTQWPEVKRVLEEVAAL
jgi:hypothetical protein